MRRAILLLSLTSALALHACGEATTGFSGDGSTATDLFSEASMNPAPDVSVRPDVPSALDTPSLQDELPPPPEDVPRPPPRDVALPDVPPSSGGIFDYVLNALTVDSTASASVPHTGFNLDGRFSSSVSSERMPADCDHGDFFSALDLDQNMGACSPPSMRCLGGVDNQLPALADTASIILDLRDQLRTQVDGGQLTFLLRVSNVDGMLSPTLDDPEVVIRVYIGRSMLSASSCSGLFAPGARFAVDRASLGDPTNLDSARFAALGSIRAGRLHIGAAMAGADLTLSLPLFALGGTSASLDLRGVQLRMDIGHDRGARGNLGGYVIAQDAVDSITSIPAAESYRAIIISLVRGLIDVQVEGSCGLNGGVGMGLGFSAVRATIDPTSVDGPQPGRCGSF